MKKTFAILFLVYLFFVFQSCFFPHLSIKGFAPDLIFTFFFILVFQDVINSREGILYGIFGGFLLDFFSLRPLGSAIFSLILLVLILEKFKSFLKKSNLVSFLVLYSVAYLVYYFLLSFFPVLLSLNLSSFIIPSVSIFGFIYDLIFALIFFLFFKKYERLFS